ncbi:MAG: Uma2 family endonuclease [Symploca sp. SIO2E6]|nr:Uma2 family endonuclease [Symploca sp. SIO2E6]
MTTTKTITKPFTLPTSGPDHTQLPESDGTFVFAERAEGKNFAEHPQSILLTDSLEPVLNRIHPDGQYAIGQDCGIYWRITKPAHKGAEAPDWFYVPGVPPNLDGKTRRSYVIWKEMIPPLIALEFASGDGSEERDSTPLSNTKEGEVTEPGKYWVYEKIMGITYYGIYVIETGNLEVYKLLGGSYRKMKPNQRGHYPIEELEVELGLWQGCYLSDAPQQWLRWWDHKGKLLLIGKEREKVAEAREQREAQARIKAEQDKQQAEQERQQAEAREQREAQARIKAEQDKQQAEQERQQAEAKIAEFQQSQRNAIVRLRDMGLTIEQIAEVQSLSVEQVMQILET